MGYAGADAADLNGLAFTILSITSATVFVIDAVTTGHTITTASGLVYYINKSNIISLLETMVRVTPEQIHRSPDFGIYIPIHMANSYQDAIIAAGAAGGMNVYQNEYGMVYKGLQLFVQPYFDANTILTTTTSNLFFGTDLVSDQNEVEALYMKPVTLDDEYRYSAKFSSSVNYGYASQVKMLYPY